MFILLVDGLPVIERQCFSNIAHSIQIKQVLGVTICAVAAYCTCLRYRS